MALRNACDPLRLDQFLHDRLPKGSQQELEEHLSDCSTCRQQLDDLAGGTPWWTEVRRYLGDEAELARTAGPSRDTQAYELDFLQPSERAGSIGRLGLYEVLEVLGRGGFGVVLKVFDPALNRPVAIKVLASDYAARGAARKRFAREARAAAAVAHEHVVPVHAVDADATPPYLVMAFIPGESLQERLDRTGPLELREILRIGMQTASGLAAAHAQGLVHRDIKPANIMLENGIERVRITDFGLARAVDDASLTHSGGVAGTPQYMAPEQAASGPVDQRADLFALGSTLYSMCTGRAAFRGESGWAVLRQVCEAEPESIRSINPDIPVWLEGIIRKLHAKDPGRRFSSAGEVAGLLEQCLAHAQQPDRHRLPAAARELRRLVPARFREEHRMGRWASVAALLLVAGLGGAGLLLLPRPVPDVPLPGPAVSDDVDGSILSWDPGATNELRVRLGVLGRSLSPISASDRPGSDPAVEQLRWKAESLRHQLAPTAERDSDPIQTRMSDLRRRLERLREQIGESE